MEFCGRLDIADQNKEVTRGFLVNSGSMILYLLYDVG